MNAPPSRILPATADDEIVAMALMLYSLPRLQDKVDALVTIPGLGEPKRFSEAIGDWEKHQKVGHLLIAGHNTREQTSKPVSPESLQQPPYSLKRTENVIIKLHAEHTGEQAEWTAQQIQCLSLESIALYAPAYHLLRAYLTFLQAIVFKGHCWIPIIPVPIINSPSVIIPEFKATAWAMVPGEVQRIHKYMEKGDVASYKDFQTYIYWLWEQPLLNQ